VRRGKNDLKNESNSHLNLVRAALSNRVELNLIRVTDEGQTNECEREKRERENKERGRERSQKERKSRERERSQKERQSGEREKSQRETVENENRQK